MYSGFHPDTSGLKFWCLFARNLDVKCPASGAIELTEKNSLPSSEYQLAVTDKNLPAAPDDGRFDMGVAVAFAVLVAGQVLRNQFFKHQQDVVGHIRVGIFVNGYRGGGVGAIKGRKAVLDTAFSNHVSNLAGDVNHLVTVFRAYVNIFVDDFHYPLAPHYLFHS